MKRFKSRPAARQLPLSLSRPACLAPSRSRSTRLALALYMLISLSAGLALGLSLGLAVIPADSVHAETAWPASAIGLPAGTATAKGSPVRIAVIDTGISTNAIAAERIAPGQNYVATGSGTEDQIGHGTALAGILVGLKGEQTGIVPNATLVPLVCITADAQGKTLNGGPDKLARAVRDAVDKYRCTVILIGSGTIDQSEALKTAIAHAESKGASVIAPVGNENETHPEAIFYPASYETVLGVAAMREDGGIATFSQRSTPADLSAPGTGLLVATIRGKTVKAYGTSYAAAFVAGAAARLRSHSPSLTPAQVRSALIDSARDVGAPGRDRESGYGALDIEAALAAARPIAAANQQAADAQRGKQLALAGLGLAGLLAAAAVVWKIRKRRAG